MRRLTLDPADDLHPVWTPDGGQIVFSSLRGSDVQNIFTQAADGSGQVARLTDSPAGQLAYAVTPDGTRLLFRQDNDLHALSLDTGRQLEVLVQSEFREMNAEVSPNGRWIAYQSNASGRFEVYVTSLSEPGSGQWQVSTGGGERPVWRRDGSELFYLAADGRLMSAPVKQESTAFGYGTPSRVLERAYRQATVPGRHYDVSPDGQRFLMMKDTDPAESTVPYQFVVVLNWFEELTRLVPAQRN
jgi:serine/threonine-protein kinase